MSDSWGGRERVGRYEVGEVIGVGSFATVHRARDPRLDTTVVLKVLAENHSLNPEVRERFIAEGRALRRVSSPHVVTLFDMGESDRQQPYHVLEHADRGTLATRVHQLREAGWAATPVDVIALSRQLTLALGAVHHARLVHRDLSPSNVLLTSDGGPSTPTGLAVEQIDTGSVHPLVRADERVLVADLGLCKDLALNSGLTVAGGTSGFRPPELSSGPAVIDERADLFSLSALITWVCRGADLPPALHAALERGRSEDPANRQADVASWLQEVTEALVPPPPPEPDPAPATHPDPQRHTATAPHPGASRTRLLLLGGLAALLLVFGALLGRVVAGSGEDASTATAQIQIVGPQEIGVGLPATFTLEHVGVRSWVWMLPDGRYLSDQDTITLTPTTPGSARIELVARDEEGRELRVVHRLAVIE